MEAAQWPAEGSRVSATARALGRKGRATASGPAANRWPRTAARRSISAPRGAGSGRVCGPRMRTARAGSGGRPCGKRSEEHTSELQSQLHLVCRLLLEKKKNINTHYDVLSY